MPEALDAILSLTLVENRTLAAAASALEAPEPPFFDLFFPVPPPRLPPTLATLFGVLLAV